MRYLNKIGEYFLGCMILWRGSADIIKVFVDYIAFRFEIIVKIFIHSESWTALEFGYDLTDEILTSELTFSNYVNSAVFVVFAHFTSLNI